MDLVVLKFGGTSLANIKLMKNAAARVHEQVKSGHKVIVVVSAMAGATDHLINLTSQISNCKTKDGLAEYANVITTGEQVSAGLFTLVLQEMGIKSRSWVNWQVGITTDEIYDDASIIKLDCYKILASLHDEYQVAVVAGFQGITINDRTSTLGRGGSDTSAILLAGNLKAKRCDIYTDVEGVFTGDPRIIAKAQKINHLNYDAMIALAHSGAKVLQEKSVKWAKEYQVKVQVLSSFTGNTGTYITHLEEAKPVIGVALSTSLILENQLDSLAINSLNIARISVIGTNIEHNDKLAMDLQSSLNASDIDVLAVQKENMILSFIIKDDLKFEGLRLLHSVCGLD